MCIFSFITPKKILQSNEPTCWLICRFFYLKPCQFCPLKLPQSAICNLLLVPSFTTSRQFPLPVKLVLREWYYCVAEATDDA
jgi:hypothetical protein